MKKINIGLIGCGVVGLKRIQNLPSSFNLIGCADPLIFSKKITVKCKNPEHIDSYIELLR